MPCCSPGRTPAARTSAEWYEKVHSYSFERFADPEFGEWFGYLNRDGSREWTAKANGWKGCFHLPRVLLRCYRLLEGSRIDERSIDRREAVFASLRFEQQRPCPYYIWIDDAMVRAAGRAVSERRTSSARRARRGPSPAATRR